MGVRPTLPRRFFRLLRAVGRQLTTLSMVIDIKHKHKDLTSKRIHFGKIVAPPKDIGATALQMDFDEHSSVADFERSGNINALQRKLYTLWQEESSSVRPILISTVYSRRKSNFARLLSGRWPLKISSQDVKRNPPPIMRL